MSAWKNVENIISKRTAGRYCLLGGSCVSDVRIGEGAVNFEGSLTNRARRFCTLSRTLRMSTRTVILLSQQLRV